MYQINPKLNINELQKDYTEYSRKYPVEFSFPYKKTYTLIIKPEEGYEYSIPESKSYATYNNNAYFNYDVQKVRGLIKVSITVEIKLISFPSSEYNNIKALFNQLNEKLEERIIIRKKITN